MREACSGENGSNSALTNDEVREIRAKALTMRYGVKDLMSQTAFAGKLESRTTMICILNNQTYKDKNYYPSEDFLSKLFAIDKTKAQTATAKHIVDKHGTYYVSTAVAAEHHEISSGSVVASASGATKKGKWAGFFAYTSQIPTETLTLIKGREVGKVAERKVIDSVRADALTLKYSINDLSKKYDLIPRTITDIILNKRYVSETYSISEEQIKAIKNLAQKQKSAKRGVKIVDKSGNVFSSRKEAADHYQIDESTIYRSVHGQLSPGSKWFGFFTYPELEESDDASNSNDV
jgi:hypothetical protein